MTDHHLTFEHPLNERTRTFLRAEHLFDLAKFRYSNSTSSWDEKDCVATIIEIYNLIERTEFKSELVKEIERNVNSLQRLGKTPAIDMRALEKVLKELERTSETMKSYSAKQGFFPKDELLSGLRQRLSIPGGTCSFDLPAFHYWLSLPQRIRQCSLTQWLEALNPLEKALSLVLELTRQSNIATREMATAGTYQKGLNPQMSCQLVRIILKTDQGVFPEISADKHRIYIRFLTPNFDQGKPALAHQNIAFELTCCMI